MAITLNGTTGISSPGGDTSTSLATTNLSYTGTLTGGTGVIAIGTNQIYKDASGNVGIGTASPSTYGKLAVLSSDNTEATVIQSLISNNTTAQLRLGFDRIVGYNTTAGNSSLDFGVTSYPQAVHIDSSGNVGIAVTSPTLTLDVERAASTVLSGTGYRVSRFTSTSSAVADKPGVILGFDTAGAGIIAAATQSAGQPLAFWTYNGATWGERARIDSSGNLGIGTTNPSKKLEVFASANSLQIESIVRNDQSGSGIAAIGFNVSASSSGETSSTKAGIGLVRQYGYGGGALCFYNNSTTSAGDFTTADERMRIDNSGNLLVGCTTNPSTYRQVLSSNNSNFWGVGPSAGNPATFYVVNNSNAGVYLTYGNTAWSSTSDERLKTDLITITNAIQKVATLRAVTGRFKTDAEGFSRAFLIAQDVQKVLPEAVDSEDPERLGVRYTDTIPLLVAAIQELTTRLEALEAQ